MRFDSENRRDILRLLTVIGVIFTITGLMRGYAVGEMQVLALCSIAVAVLSLS